MAKPVITQPASPRIIAAGTAFSLSLSASGSPTSWAATGLPSGLAINTSTGAITGTPVATATTTSTVSITATNGDGTSDAVLLTLTVMATPPGFSGSPWDLILDYEVGVSNAVTIPGKEAPAEGEPLFHLPTGTNRYLLIGVKHFGVLQDINPDDEDITLHLAAKQFEPEAAIELYTGAAEKIAGATPDTQRYRVPVRIQAANWATPLSDEEQDAGTYIDALYELQVTRGAVAELHDATLTDTGIAIEGGISAAITGDHDFTGIEEFAVATPMRLTLTLSVTGRPLQTVTLVRTFDLIFSGGAFVLSNLSGSTTGQGAAEGLQWRATLNLTALAGDADSVDADYSITTTDDAVAPYYVWEIETGVDLTSETSVSFAPQPYLTLWSDDPGTVEIGSGELLDASYADGDAVLAALAAAWDSLAGGAEIVSVVAGGVAGGTITVAVITVLGSTSVRSVGFDSTDPPGSTESPTTVPTAPEGTPTTCSVSARLEQLSDPTSVPLNLTSDAFRVRVARDIVPDPS